MKVCIIVFSPSRHTLTVAKKLSEYLEENNSIVQLIDTTRNREIFTENNMKEFFNENIKEYDVLCIGGPVYAGHIESDVKKIINSLPKVNEKFGIMSVPFITYGGLHSSIALREAGNLLVKNGRKVIAGMKIASFHTLSKTLKNVINANKPNNDDFKIIRELADRIIYLYKNKQDIEDVRESFDYAPDIEKELCSKMSQDDFHRDFRNVTFNSDVCIGCGTCVNHCLVNRLELVNGKVAIKKRQMIV